MRFCYRCGRKATKRFGSLNQHYGVSVCTEHAENLEVFMLLRPGIQLKDAVQQQRDFLWAGWEEDGDWLI